MSQDSSLTSPHPEQVIASQRHEWRFERVGWLLMGLVLCAGLVGALGDGPLAHGVATDRAGGTILEYDRILRFGTLTRLSLSIPATSGRDTVAAVRLNRTFLDAVELRGVSPEPIEVRGATDHVEYRVRRAEPGQSVRVEFQVAPTSVGRQHVVVRTQSALLLVRPFVLP